MSELTLIQQIIVSAIPVIFAITVHEVAHGWMAGQLGDQTARLMGRLTLNPIKHIDPIGTIVVPLIMLTLTPFMLGWAKPVPVDWRNLRHPRRDMAWVAVAGPSANLIMLLFWALFAKVLMTFGFTSNSPFVIMAGVGVMINIVLIVLNLIPIPPLDGSRIVSSLLPPRTAILYNRLEPYGLLIVLVLMVTGKLGDMMMPAIAAMQRLVQQLIF
jgi:Zn-dependent protease